MGSWDETCAISNLPISPGDKVYWLLLTKNPYTKFSETGCYSNDFFFVRSIPILGKYEDCGEVKVSDGEELFVQAMLNQFKVDLVEWLYKDNRKKDGSISNQEYFNSSEVILENLTFDNLQQWLHEGIVSIDNNALNDYHFEEDEDGKIKRVYKKLPVKSDPVVKVMIRKDVWDSLNSLTINNWSGLINSDYFKKKEKDLLAPILAEDKSEEEVKMLRHILHSRLKDISTDSAFLNTYAESLENLIKRYIDKDISEKELRKTTVRSRELKMLETVMAFTRRAWFPTVGAGSQTLMFDLHTEVFKKFTGIAEKAQKEYEDEE